MSVHVHVSYYYDTGQANDVESTGWKLQKFAPSILVWDMLTTQKPSYLVIERLPNLMDKLNGVSKCKEHAKLPRVAPSFWIRVLKI